MDRRDEPGEVETGGGQPSEPGPPRRAGLGGLVRRLVPRGRFAKRLLLLSGGTLVGQGIVVAVSPLLTRLFTPEEFGLLTVFSALSGFPGVLMGLRYELAVPLAKTDEDAAAVVVLTLLVVAAMGVLSAVVTALGAPWLAAMVGMPDLAPLLWLLPPILMFWGIALPLSYWSVRRGSFGLNASGRIVQAGSMSAAQLGAGWAGLGGAGLIGGLTLGQAARCVHFVATLPRRDWPLLRRVRPRRVLAMARDFWRYPVLSLPSGLLQTATLFLPGVLLAGLYGAAFAGWYGLAQRMLDLPVRLLSNTASEVFLSEVANRAPREVYRLCLRTIVRFAVVGTLGMAPLLLLAPALFALVFGESWREAGAVVQVLIPLQLARFIVIPVSQTLYVFERHDLHFVSALLNVAALAVSFSVGWALQLTWLTTLLLLSLGSCFAYIAYGVMALMIARRRFIGG